MTTALPPNRPITNPDLVRASRAVRDRVLVDRAFVVSPLNAYSLSFDAVPSRLVVQRVNAAVRRHRREPAVPGHVYVFHDPRDAVGRVKLGRTTTRPRRRVAQWSRKLGVKVDYLFAYPTTHNVLAEAVLHAVLLAEWQPNLYNVETGERALEYFDVGDRQRLRVLVVFVTRWVNARYPMLVLR